MKKIFILFLSCIAFAANAQLHLPFANNNVSAGLSTVIKDYPNHFSHIKGEVIIHDVQSTDYSCNVQVAGASSIVTMHGEDKEDVYSWKAVLLQTDDFEKAKAKIPSIIFAGKSN